MTKRRWLVARRRSKNCLTNSSSWRKWRCVSLISPDVNYEDVRSTSIFLLFSSLQTKTNVANGPVQKKKHTFLRKGEGHAKYVQSNNSNASAQPRFSDKVSAPPNLPCNSSSPRAAVHHLKKHEQNVSRILILLSMWIKLKFQMDAPDKLILRDLKNRSLIFLMYSVSVF